MLNHFGIERWRKNPHKWKKLNQKAKVTIAIGILCKPKGMPPAIILASDSQTTYGATKSLDAKKISIVEFLDAQILVAQAGTAELADKAIQIMQEKAKDRAIESAEMIADVAREAMREVRNHLYELNKGCITTDEGWKQFFLRENYFRLLVAYFFDHKPYMVTLDIDFCLPIPVKTPYIAIGCGRDMGEFLLREHHEADPEFVYGLAIAASVVEKVIDSVDGCGRPTWLGNVFATPEDVLDQFEQQMESFKRNNTPPPRKYFKSQCRLASRKDMETVAAEIKIAEIEALPDKRNQMLKILQRIAKKNFDEIQKETDDAIKEGR